MSPRQFPHPSPQTKKLLPRPILSDLPKPNIPSFAEGQSLEEEKKKKARSSLENLYRGLEKARPWPDAGIINQK